MDNLEKKLNTYLGVEKTEDIQTEGQSKVEEEEVCDIKTGECYTIRTRDGLVEKVNKTMMTEDGRTLLNG
jgi:hypothetical protein|tara:strand:+ start:1724 stop:1933 length:210 start_codon:yes stop_codon:yes gene_type:complete